jgi:GNAT superfamily N-acetyltransferase
MTDGGEKKGADGRIRLLEEISIDAWPALQTSLYDGWVVRFADGFSRRSNSIAPLYPSQTDLRKKIGACESLFRERGLRTVFKVTAASQPPELDAVLAAEGYRPEAETGVQLLPLDRWNTAPAPDAELEEELTEEWLRALCALNEYDPRHHGTVAKLTALIHPPRIFASARREGKIAAVGLGVVRHGHVCLFDIVVEGNHRRQGLGRQIVTSLLEWGKRKSAAAGYLQVMTNNPVAAALYAGLGFREVYRYVYRAKE